MFLAHVVVPPFTARGLSGNTDEEADWRQRWERLKLLGLHNKSIGCGASGAYALGPWWWKKKNTQTNVGLLCCVGSDSNIAVTPRPRGQPYVITAITSRDMRQTKYEARNGLMTDAFRIICRAVQGVRAGQRLEHRRAGCTKVEVWNRMWNFNILLTVHLNIFIY